VYKNNEKGWSTKAKNGFSISEAKAFHPFLKALNGFGDN
jgi:hypothetical protein